MPNSVLDRKDSEAAAVAVAHDLDTARRNVAALGAAIHAAGLTSSPELARATQAQQSLYDSIEREFGLLTSAQVADRLGSRAQARRNAATAARREGRLVALQRGRYLAYPGFQFDGRGARPLIAELRAVAETNGWDETSLIEWLVAPTTYLGGRRPVDLLDDPSRVLEVARGAFGVSW
jgi:hypothetical protein